jgi:lambda family phage portal protein
MAGKHRIARPSLVDRVMERFRPGHTLRRSLAAVKTGAIREARSHYDAAKRARRSQHWRIAGEDANAAARGNLQPLRAIARDMTRNNAHARRAVDAITSNMVGAGILPQVKGVSRTRQKTIEKLLRRHLMTPAIDADGLHTLAGLQALVVRTVITSGECLVRRRWRRPDDQLPLPFQLQVLEPDFIDHTVDGPQANGNMAVQGVEFDAIGRRVAYHLHAEHPGATTTFRLPTSRRVPAEDIAHVFLADRPGQARGVTWFAPVILKMRDFADFGDAQLVRQKIAACFAAFVTGDPDSEQEVDGETSATGKPLESFEPGMIEYLDPGQSVEFANPPQVTDYESFQLATLHEIAAGLNVPYTVLTGDLRQVNFSSGRMGWIEFGRMIEQWRELMLVPLLLWRVERWIAEALHVGKGIRGEEMEIDWIAPRREMIDPQKEIGAAKDAVRAGFSSRSYEQRRFGFDPDDLEDEIAADNERADGLGLVFDSDPRKTAAQGSMQAGDEPDDTSDDAPPKKPKPAPVSRRSIAREEPAAWQH